MENNKIMDNRKIVGKIKTWNFCASVVASITYFIIAEDKTSIVAFMAIMNYLFYIDDKIDEKE